MFLYYSSNVLLIGFYLIWVERCFWKKVRLTFDWLAKSQKLDYYECFLFTEVDCVLLCEKVRFLGKVVHALFYLCLWECVRVGVHDPFDGVHVVVLLKAVHRHKEVGPFHLQISVGSWNLETKRWSFLLAIWGLFSIRQARHLSSTTF